MQDTEKKFYPIKGFEDYYEVTKCGVVRRKLSDFEVSKQRPFKKPMTGFVNRDGYRVIVFTIGGKIVSRTSVHRLVANTFLENPDNLAQVNHIDGNKLNNNLENLEHCSCSDNLKHRFRVLGMTQQTRHLSDESVIDIYTNAILLNKKGSRKDSLKSNIDFYAKKHNVNTHVIYHLLKNYSYLNITKNLKRKGE